ncbi:MAG: class I SAM-dependent methyltransferase [Chloroflexi bacterium]|nr:MAG: class I SAM-dependent methyltransferase [Chloroflexota bacterium]MBL1193171.1 class I SAM-dependent methyltransferase [Chloroflexota bacterium]NOH10464.1 class I SAM-dependent methyltransferase [Chloroflexota bacterium]
MTIFDWMEDTGPYQAVRNGMNMGLVNFFQRHVFEGQQGLRVAEVACGSGYASHLIAQRPEVGLSVAADINMIYHQQANLKEFDARFVLNDIFKPSFEPASFDLVWNSSSVEHFEDSQSAVAAMTSMVKPSGHVFVGVPYVYGPMAMYYLMPTEAQREWVGKPFTGSRLEHIFQEVGLEPLKQIVYLARSFVGILGRKK